MLSAIPSNIRRMKPSATLAINQLAAELENTGREIIRLGFGQSPFPIPQFMTTALQRECYRGEYTSSVGIQALRESIAAYYAKRDSRDISADDVIIAPGSKELLYLIQVTCQNADVFIPSPSWVSYPAQVNMLSKFHHTIKTTFNDKWKVNPTSLQTLKNFENENKLLILNYPNNPTGQTFTVEEFRDITPILRETNTVVLCDEIYHDLHFNYESATSLARYLPERCIITSGLSKSYAAGGWRLGYMVFPKELSHLKNTIAALASETYSCATTPVQYAAVHAFTQASVEEAKQLDDYHKKCRKILEAVGKKCTDILNSYGIRCHYPEGGFYIYPDFHYYLNHLRMKNINSGEDMCRKILEDTGVTLLPSKEFGSSPGEIQVRLCFIDFDGEKALQDFPKNGLIDEEWLKTHCGKVINGVELIGNWTKKISE